jgi:hypothetical protein
MTVTVKIKEYFRMEAPYLNLKIRWSIRKPIRKKVGNRAG